MSQGSHPRELFDPPTLGDFEKLEEDMWKFAGEPDSLSLATGYITRFHIRPRVQEVENDEGGKNHQVWFSVSGTLRVVDAVRKLDIDYIEVVNQSIIGLRKTYMLEVRGDTVSNYTRSLTLQATGNRPVNFDKMTPEQAKEFAKACESFEGLTGPGIKLTSGDCEMLHNDLRAIQKLGVYNGDIDTRET